MRLRTRRVLLLVALPLLLAPVSILLLPRARAAFRYVSGFSQHPLDQRLFFEPGNEEQAEALARASPEAVRRVEDAHGRPFKHPFRVYFCASHESFTRHLGMALDSPVRGLAFPWDVWVSPLAFSFYGRDTHIQSVAHELSHLHVRQHLGWIRSTRLVPTWFAEGLADWAAGTGFEIVSREEALALLFRDQHFQPDAKGQLPMPRSLRDYGVSPPLLHAQSRLFLEHLVKTDPQAFEQVVDGVLRGGSLGPEFRLGFGVTLSDAWAGFLAEPPNQSTVSGPKGSS